MASIELYKNKMNTMSECLHGVKTAVGNFSSELAGLKSKVLGINNSVCDKVISRISSSSQTQEQQIAQVEATRREVDNFIDLVVKRDNSACAAVSQAKKDFYKKYDYLKPDCEKTGWEKFCEGLKKAGEWCKEHWKEILLVAEIIAGIACLFIPGLQGIGTGILMGALKGAITGAVMGGIASVMSGGSLLDGMRQGALDGAIMGGALGGVGGLASKFLTCGSKLGNAVKLTAKISGTASDLMDGFDMASMGLGFIAPGNPITAANNKLHQSELYNKVQKGTSMVSQFSGAAAHSMACFVAGTMVLTTAGFVAIEKISVGDKVISADPETAEGGEKTVIETFVREVNRLVHLKLNGKEIVTTDNHPFYVQERGFINAGCLFVGDKLVSVDGKDLVVEDISIEDTAEPVSVYNLRIEDFHTYFVGDCCVWVHNAGKEYSENTPKKLAERQKEGHKYEQQQHNKLKRRNPTAEAQVVVKPLDKNGNPMKSGGNYLDDLFISKDGKMEIREYKLSPKSPYQKNQLKNGFSDGILNKDMMIMSGSHKGEILPKGTVIETFRKYK